MAVKLSANYSKKLGLPAYSSHSFSASVEIELTDLSQVEAECRNLYDLLQRSVDQQIQQVGFVPEPGSYGLNGNGAHAQSNGSPRHSPVALPERWNCTEGQRGFILRILHENSIDAAEAEALAQQFFALGMKQLNKMQASQLIEELLLKAGKPARQARWRKPPQPQPTPVS